MTINQALLALASANHTVLEAPGTDLATIDAAAWPGIIVRANITANTADVAALQLLALAQDGTRYPIAQVAIAPGASQLCFSAGLVGPAYAETGAGVAIIPHLTPVAPYTGHFFCPIAARIVVRLIISATPAGGHTTLSVDVEGYPTQSPGSDVSG